MHIYGEIEYYRKSDGQAVHSDICCDLKTWEELLPEYMDEIVRLADLTKDWKIYGGTICTVHTKKGGE